MLVNAFRSLGFSVLVAATGPALADPVMFDAPEPLQALLTEHIALEWAADDRTDHASRQTLLRRAREVVPSLLGTEGYFTPTLRWGDNDHIQVDPGPRTRIAEVDIQFIGDLSTARQTALRTNWLLPVAAPFRQADWDSAKQELLRNLDDDGYPGARLGHSEARIDPVTHRASLQLQVRVGPLHRYGPLQISGLSRYQPALVERYTERLQPGQPYRRVDILTTQRSLQLSPYFDAVMIEVEPISDDSRDDDHDDDHGNGNAVHNNNNNNNNNEQDTVQVPVVIQVRERVPHRLSFGIGASSNTGPRVLANYGFPDLFGQAWDFGAGMQLERNRQQYFSDLFFPRSRSGYQDGVGALYEESNIEGLHVERRAWRAERIEPDLQFEKRYRLTLERSDETPAEGKTNRYQALVPGLSLVWRHVDDIRKPRAGGVWSADVAVASEDAASDASFAYLLMRGEYFYSVSDQWVLGLRTELGANWAVNSDAIPQSYLFRTGGSQTVRGYDYLSIGRDVDGAVVGAKRLVVASAELVYWFTENWGGAVFVDAGDAKDSMTQIDPLLGYGIGARWQTPAGPLAFDFARGERDSDIHFHFTIAVPF